MTDVVNKDNLIDQIEALTVNDGELNQNDVNYLINYLIAKGDMTGTPRDLIQIRRGSQENLPFLAQGELAFTMDSENFYVGGINGNVLVGKPTYEVNVKDYGAKGNGNADDTAAFNKAFAASTNVIVPAGTYKVGKLTIPSTVKSLRGYGTVKFIPSASVPSVLPDSWITALSLSDAVIYNIGFEVDHEVFPQLRCLDLTKCTNVIVELVRAYKGGGIAIYGANCNYVTVRKCRVDSFAYKGISFDGATQSNILITNNVVEGTGSAHCVSVQLGSVIKVSENYLKNAGSFGVGMYQVSYCEIKNNNTYNTIKEGINIEDSSFVKIIANTCRWDAGIGLDFGISVFGNAVATQFNDVIDNSIVYSFASGIALADKVSFNNVTGNKVFSCNHGRVANQAGILLYGSDCVKNTVSNNVVVDTVPSSNFGISEYSFGTGNATLNTITSNFVEGYLVNDVHRITNDTTVSFNHKDMMAFRPYTPTVTSLSGSLTKASAEGSFLQVGKIIFFYVRATVATNGTGAGALVISLPFSASKGNGSGKEVATSGKAVTAEINNGENMIVRGYDNLYPAVDGSIVDITGMFQVI